MHINSIIDIDECAEQDKITCQNDAHCVNTNGSYQCVCNEGYEEDDNLVCQGE